MTTINQKVVYLNLPSVSPDPLCTFPLLYTKNTYLSNGSSYQMIAEQGSYPIYNEIARLMITVLLR